MTTSADARTAGHKSKGSVQVGYMWADMMLPAFWIAVGQIIWINILLSGDNAVVIALACRSLPPRQRFWGILLGAGAAVLLRIFFTIIIAQIMGDRRSSSWSAACCCSGSRSS